MDTVISVNVGLPRDVQWQGKTVWTAVWKRPLENRVMAHRLNLAGDGQGDLLGHGGEHRAVMVYQLDSYRHWQTFFGDASFVAGQFGENLTVDGLADTEVCIGDRYRIGDAIFEVTQPRVTCYRVGLRMNRADMPALLVSHRRPGFYFRVLQEGEVGAGDEIVKVAAGPEQISVAEMDALLYLPDRPRDRLQRALQIPALSPGWQGSLRALLVAATDGTQTGNAGLSASVTAPPAWEGFRSLKVISSAQESDDVRSFVLAAPDGSRLPGASPGQYIVARLRSPSDRTPLTRSYSLSGPPNEGTYRISVKHEVGGAASEYLHNCMTDGNTLEASAPRGAFELTSGTTPVVLLSAGIGVTPLLAMLYALTTADTSSPREVWWVHNARDGDHHPFAQEVRGLIRSLPRGHAFTLYSRPRQEDEVGTQYDTEGRISMSVLQEYHVPLEAEFYLCGPAGFLDQLTSGLRLVGVPESRIHTEVFGPGKSFTPGIASAARKAPHPPSGDAGTGPAITFTRSGLVVAWDPRFQSLLEFAEACDIPVKWSCRAGVCHTCECALIDGQVRYVPDPLDRPADGDVLTCCSTPMSDVQLEL